MLQVTFSWLFHKQYTMYCLYHLTHCGAVCHVALKAIKEQPKESL